MNIHMTLLKCLVVGGWGGSSSNHCWESCVDLFGGQAGRVDYSLKYPNTHNTDCLEAWRGGEVRLWQSQITAGREERVGRLQPNQT